MTEKFINLRDLSPLQRELTGLPFGIVDKDHRLLEKLHVYVAHHHSDHPNKGAILQTLYQRFELISNNRAALANMYERDPEEIEVTHILTRVFRVENQLYQTLTSDICVKLSDSRARYSQLPITFHVDKDFKTWKAIEPLVELQFEVSEETAVVSEEVLDSKDIGISA